MRIISCLALLFVLLQTVNADTPAPVGNVPQSTPPAAQPEKTVKEEDPAKLAAAAAVAPQRIIAIQTALKAGIARQRLDEEARQEYLAQQKVFNQARMAHRGIYGRLRIFQSDTNSLWSSVDVNNCLKKIVERIAKENKERSYESRKAKRRNNIDDLIRKYDIKAQEYNAASYGLGSRGEDCKCRKCSLPEKIKAAEAECKVAQETLQTAQDELNALEEKFTKQYQDELTAQKALLNRYRLQQEKLVKTGKTPEPVQ